MSEAPSRSRGRPRSIDRDVVLAQLMDVFWAKGFDGASLDDLTGAAGVSRPSLDRLFGDKRAVFLAAIEAYAQGIGSEPMVAFEAEEDIGCAVAAFLRRSAQNNTSPDHPPGCLIGCCATMSATEMPDVAEHVRAVFDGTRDRLAQRFESEVRAGTIAAGPDPQLRAGMMVDLMNGYAVRARAGASRDDLLADLPSRTAAVLSRSNG